MASSSTLVHFIILTSIFLHNFNFCSAHNRRMLALKKPTTLQFGSDETSSMPTAPAEGDATLPTLQINFEEPTLMPSPPMQQEPAANIAPSFFPLPGLPSLPRLPPFPFIPTLPFFPGFDNSGFDTIPADPIPPPPMTEP